MTNASTPREPTSDGSPEAPSETHRRARHLETLEHLQRGLAHDSKGPLNAMGLQLELLRATLDGESELAEKQARWLAGLREELDRLSEMLHRVTDLFRPPDPRPGPVDLAGLLREIEGLVAAESRQRRIPLRFDLPAAPIAPVLASRDILQQALMALITDRLVAVPDPSAGQAKVVVTLETDPEGAAAGSPSPRVRVAFEQVAFEQVALKQVALERGADRALEAIGGEASRGTAVLENPPIDPRTRSLLEREGVNASLIESQPIDSSVIVGFRSVPTSSP